MSKQIFVQVGSQFQGTRAVVVIPESNPVFVSGDTIKHFLKIWGWEDPADTETAIELLLAEHKAMHEEDARQ